MLSIVSFGDYVFDQSAQVSYTDNFRDLAESSHRAFASDGAIDEYGLGPSPGVKGQVTIATWVIGNVTRELAQIGGMAASGTARLTSINDKANQYFADARIKTIEYTQDVHSLSHLRQLVSITWDVYDPFWKDVPSEEQPLWGQAIWGRAIWGGISIRSAIADEETDFVLNVGGNSATAPSIRVTVSEGQSISSGITVQRLSGMNVVDEVRYAGSISTGSELEIDCESYRVLLNGINAWGELFSYMRSRWFALQGGEGNTIKVIMAAGDAGSIAFHYENRWR